MKAFIGWIGALVAVVFVVGTSHAIDVVNEDMRGYQITITSSAKKRDMQLEARTLSLVVCVGTCEFYVPGLGRAQARGNDTVTIRNGKLDTESK
jgi:hypothetical protein